MHLVLEDAELVITTHEGCLSEFTTTCRRRERDDANGPIRGNEFGLPLDLVITRRSELDRAAGEVTGRLAGIHLTGRGDRLESRGGVDEIADDQAVLVAARSH